MAPKFGTSGLRGLSTELTDDLCATYAAAFLSLQPNSGRLFIGQDMRDSSPRIAAAVGRGAASVGVEVVDCGVLPTPALARAAMEDGTVSIMVTGSHIPADRNGLKFYTAAGEFTKADEAPLIAEVGRRGVPEASTAGSEAQNADAAEAYVARYVDGFADNALSGKRVGVWLHSSAAGEVLPRILTGLGAEVVLLGRSDTFVPVDTEAVDTETRAMLAEWVQRDELDAILSTDGDADRPLLVDDQGRVVPGDILGPITALWCGADEVVTTVSANTLVDLMERFDGVSRTRIGSPYVIAEMEARVAAGVEKVVGYEPNGGFLLGWDLKEGDKRFARLMTRDAMLPMMATLAAAAEAGLPISEMLAGFPERRTATDRLQDIPREKSVAIVDAILSGDHAVLPAGLGKLVATDTTDGARLSFASGHVVHIRPSGNAPELRCYVEADSDAAAEAILSEALERLRQATR